MNQLLVEINEIPLIIGPEIIQQHQIKSITGFYRSNTSDKEYKYVLLEYDQQGYLMNFEKYDPQGKIICKRNFDNKGKLLNEKHFIGSNQLEFQYDIEYQPGSIIKTMKDPLDHVLGKTKITKSPDSQHYKISNYNKDGIMVSEFDYIYSNGKEMPEIVSKTRGDFHFHEEKDKIVLNENIPSAPKNSSGIIFFRDTLSKQITKVEKNNNYTIDYQIHTY